MCRHSSEGRGKVFRVKTVGKLDFLADKTVVLFVCAPVFVRHVNVCVDCCLTVTCMFVFVDRMFFVLFLAAVEKEKDLFSSLSGW